LHAKLSLAESIVQKAIDLLSSTSNKDPQLKDLKNSLLTLKLKDIEIDVSSTQVQLFGEISALRTSILQGNSPNMEGIGDREALLKDKESMDATIKALQEKLGTSDSTIRILREELETLKTSPTSASAKAATVDPTTSVELQSQIAALKAEVQALKAQLDSKEIAGKVHASQVASLQAEIQVLKSDKGSKADVVNANNSQINALQTEIQTLQTELSNKSKHLSEKEAIVATHLASIALLTKQNDLSVKGSATKDSEIVELKAANNQLQKKVVATIEEYEAKISNSSASLLQQSKEQIAEIEAKLESEKEEMMEAMAQEIEVRYGTVWHHTSHDTLLL